MVRFSDGPAARIRLDDVLRSLTEGRGVSPSGAEREAVVEAFANPWRLIPGWEGRRLPGSTATAPYSYTIHPLIEELFVRRQGYRPRMLSQGSGEDQVQELVLQDRTGAAFLRGFEPVTDAQGAVIGFNPRTARFHRGRGEG